MNVGPEFVPFRAALVNREVNLILDTCVQEVLWDEIRLQSQQTTFEEPKAFIFMASSSEDTALFATRGQKV